MTLDTNVGYAFTEHLSGDIGLPVIFTRSPFSPVLNHDYYWWVLLGQPYLDVRYTGSYHGANFTSILTGSVPVANQNRIYTTGRFGVDWFNHVESEIVSGVTPFLNFGASNGAANRFIMPRPYTEARPYQTLGFLGDFEAGAEYKISRSFAKGVGIGASAYAVVPGGPQKVFSRYVAPYSVLAGDGQHLRYFDSTFETTGSSKIARDNGFSLWLDVRHWHPVDMQVGYTRSPHYHLDIYTVTFTFDGRSLIRGLIGK